MANNKRTYVITTIPEFTDPSGTLTVPDGIPGDTGWIELTNKPVLLGLYTEITEKEAIDNVTSKYNIPENMLHVYKI